MKRTTTVEEVDTAIELLSALRAEVAAELAPLENAPTRLARPDRERRAHLQRTIEQIDKGLHPADGADGRLWRLLERPEVSRFRFVRPGIAVLQRERERLLAEAGNAKPPQTWPQPFRLKEGFKHWLPERDLQPGEVIELTEAQAAAFADKFEPAQAEPV